MLDPFLFRAKFEELPLIKIKFYKKEGKWYAQVPDSPEEENLMVGEAAQVIDELAGGKDHIKFYVSTEFPHDFKDECVAKMFLKEHDDNGGTYSFEQYGLSMSSFRFNHVWLCNVAHLVFNEHPQEINIYKFE